MITCPHGGGRVPIEPVVAVNLERRAFQPMARHIPEHKAAFADCLA
jgi:hypothetical protein